MSLLQDWEPEAMRLADVLAYEGSVVENVVVPDGDDADGDPATYQNRSSLSLLKS